MVENVEERWYSERPPDELDDWWYSLLVSTTGLMGRTAGMIDARTLDLLGI
jgi:hypothetical protein